MYQEISSLEVLEMLLGKCRVLQMTLHCVGSAPRDLEMAFTEAIECVEEYLCAVTLILGNGISMEIPHDADLDDLFIQYCQWHLERFLKFPEGIDPETGDITSDVE